MRQDVGNLIINNAKIFDGASPHLLHGSIRIQEGRITRIEPGPQTGTDCIDAQGRTVIPGLIDAHFHAYGYSLNLIEAELGPLSYSALAGAKRLESALHRGFTTVRDVAGGDIGLANAISEKLFDGPRYLYTGPALSQTGGHGDPRKANEDSCFPGGHLCEVVDGVDDLIKAVRRRFRTGSHAIKIMTSGGVVSPVDPIRVPQYSAAEVQAVTAEASRRGSYVAAHAYSPEAIQHSVRNGVRCIEHGNLLDQETAELMADRHAFLVPTLAAYDAMERRGSELGLPAVSAAKNKEVLEAGKSAIGIALAAGVRVGFGTDLLGPLEVDQLHGLRLQIEAVGVLETLRSATSVNAAILQRPDLGTISEGAVADLLVLAGDPFQDPAVIWDEARSRTVIKAGVQVAKS